MKRLTEEQKNKIRELHAAGLSSLKIAELVGCGKSSVGYIVNSEYREKTLARQKELRAPNLKRSKRKSEQFSRLVPMAEAGLTVVEMAKKLHVSTATVVRRLEELEISFNHKNLSISRSDEDQIIALYRADVSMAQIGKRFSRPPTSIMNVLRRRGVGTRPKGTNQTKDPMEAHIQKLVANVRSRTRQALNFYRANKSFANHELFGMPYDEWLLLQPKELVDAFMAKKSVHVDEIRPLSSFDLNDAEQQKLAFNWRNRRLLLGSDNMSKGSNWNPDEWEKMMRAKGWKGELYLENQKDRSNPLSTINCFNCGVKFFPNRKNARFCSAQCRSQSFRKRSKTTDK